MKDKGHTFMGELQEYFEFYDVGEDVEGEEESPQEKEDQEESK